MRRAPKGWTSTNFLKRSKRTNEGTPAPCFIHPDAPGLVVNEDGEGYWVVSHARSGCFVNPTFDRPDLACSFALAIAVQGDWRRSARELIADQALRGGVVLVRERPEFASGIVTEACRDLPVDVLDA